MKDLRRYEDTIKHFCYKVHISLMESIDGVPLPPAVDTS